LDNAAVVGTRLALYGFNILSVCHFVADGAKDCGNHSKTANAD